MFSIITDAGSIFLNEVMASANANMSLVEVQLGSGIVADQNEAKSLVLLKETKLTFPIESITPDPDNNANVLNFILHNVGLTTGFHIKELGIFAQKTDGSKVLLWYINYEDSSSYLQDNSKGLVSAPTELAMAINPDDLTVENASDSTFLVTKEFLNEELQKVLADAIVDGVVSSDKLRMKSSVNDALYAVEPDDSSKAFITISTVGSLVLGLGKDGQNPNDVRLGLVVADTGEFVDRNTDEAKGTGINIDGKVEAEVVKSRTDIQIGNAIIRYNENTRSMDFIFNN